MKTRGAGRFRGVLTLGLALVPAGCALPSASERVQGAELDRAGFPEVAQVLVQHCGTLDCHGMVGRNLRLYGYAGLRLAHTDTPTRPECITSDEIDQDYASVVGLEPELLRAVVADGGARPERLSLVRKARGSEHHKGGVVFQANDAPDRCLISWLAGETDTTACESALRTASCVADAAIP